MTVLEMTDATKRYGLRRSRGHLALDGVSLAVRSGQTVALVGQSGSGKSTIAKLLTLLERPTGGTIQLDGEPVPRSGTALRRYRQHVRMVFQDPFASLNPSLSVRRHLVRPLQIHRVVPAAEVEAEVRRLLERVRLDPDQTLERRPHELSGGQRQRVAIARALASRPSILIADEPVSMLDVSIRIGVLRLLAQLQREDGLGVLYITHDLATARHFSDQILVLHHGRVVERGPADEVILAPTDPYTQRLRAAAPDPERLFGSPTADPRASPDVGRAPGHATGGREAT